MRRLERRATELRLPREETNGLRLDKQCLLLLSGLIVVKMFRSKRDYQSTLFWEE